MVLGADREDSFGLTAYPVRNFCRTPKSLFCVARHARQCECDARISEQRAPGYKDSPCSAARIVSVRAVDRLHKLAYSLSIRVAQQQVGAEPLFGQLDILPTSSKPRKHQRHSCQRAHWPKPVYAPLDPRSNSICQLDRQIDRVHEPHARMPEVLL